MKRLSPGDKSKENVARSANAPSSDHTPTHNPAASTENLQTSQKGDAKTDVTELAALQDRVVQTLLDKKIVSPETVAIAYNSWLSRPPEERGTRLWRYLLAGEDVDRYEIQMEAAATYAFDATDFSMAEAIELLQNIQDRFSDDHWRAMRELNVAPFAIDRHPNTGKERLRFVSPDPARIELDAFLHALPISAFTLSFASEYVVWFLLKHGIQTTADVDGASGDDVAGKIIPLRPRPVAEDQDKPAPKPATPLYTPKKAA